MLVPSQRPAVAIAQEGSSARRSKQYWSGSLVEGERAASPEFFVLGLRGIGGGEGGTGGAAEGVVAGDGGGLAGEAGEEGGAAGGHAFCVGAGAGAGGADAGGGAEGVAAGGDLALDIWVGCCCGEEEGEEEEGGGSGYFVWHCCCCLGVEEGRKEGRMDGWELPRVGRSRFKDDASQNSKGKMHGREGKGLVFHVT